MLSELEWISVKLIALNAELDIGPIGDIYK